MRRTCTRGIRVKKGFPNDLCGMHGLHTGSIQGAAGALAGLSACAALRRTGLCRLMSMALELTQSGYSSALVCQSKLKDTIAADVVAMASTVSMCSATVTLGGRGGAGGAGDGWGPGGGVEEARVRHNPGYPPVWCCCCTVLNAVNVHRDAFAPLHGARTSASPGLALCPLAASAPASVVINSACDRGSDSMG